MVARKFGPEEHDRDAGDCMAQIQELQELLAEQAGGSRSSLTGEVHQLAASRVEFDDIMAFDLEAQLASHDGVTRFLYVILIPSFCVFVSPLHIFTYSGLVLVLTCSLMCPYCYSRCGRLSSSSLSKGRLLYSFIFVHISYIFIFRSQATFILGESSETILLFVDSGGSEVGHVPLDVRND
jgi:hypothetical protein